MAASLPGSFLPTPLRRWRQRYRRGWRPLQIVPTQAGDEQQRRGMVCFWLDGLFASVSDSFVGPYLTLYLLALGATGQQVGLLTSVIGLAGAVMFLPGARLAGRYPNYRGLVVVTSLGARVVLALLILLPWFASQQAAIAGVIALSALREACGQLGNPAWTAFSAMIVPEQIRGRFFASRTLAWNLAAVAVVPLAGRLISALGSPRGYQVSFGLALGAGMLSTWSYSRIPVATARPGCGQQGSLRRALASLPRQPLFLRFWLTSMLLNLGVQFAAPFMNVHLVRGLGAQISFVGLATTVQTGASLAGARIFGPLVDRKGLRWTMVRTGPFVALIPFLWLFARAPWHILPINVMAGLAWAGYNLATFNLLLTSTPAEERPLYSAIYNTGSALTTMVGPLVGGFLFDRWGFQACLASSFVGRGVAAALVFLLLREAGRRLEEPARADATP